MLHLKFWLRFSIFNLMVVALFGVVMRYKIGFEFPFFDQKNLQHGHSHFAFAAWISQTLYVLIYWHLQSVSNKQYLTVFNNLFLVNALSAWGMLIAFSINGYGAFSIALSQINTITSYVFLFYYFKAGRDLVHIPSIKWFKWALSLNAISSIGTYVLSYMMINKSITQNLYLSSVYFFLHFQYNGWFLFACIGLLIAGFNKLIPDFKIPGSTIKLYIFSVFPAYLLSVLWLKLPLWLHFIVILASIIQLLAWQKLLGTVYKAIKLHKTILPTYIKFTLALIAIAYTSKLLLQLGSTIPEISTLAFGFRPIVIAYLHLVLLGIISVFLLTYIMGFIFQETSLSLRLFFLCFAAGVYLNEIALGIQGIASLSYTLVPYMNHILFIVSLWMMLSLAGLFVKFKQHQLRE